MFWCTLIHADEDVSKQEDLVVCVMLTFANSGIDEWKERISQKKTSDDSKFRVELQTMLSSDEQRLVYLWVATHPEYLGRCVDLFGSPPYHFLHANVNAVHINLNTLVYHRSATC